MTSLACFLLLRYIFLFIPFAAKLHIHASLYWVHVLGSGWRLGFMHVAEVFFFVSGMKKKRNLFSEWWRHTPITSLRERERVVEKKWILISLTVSVVGCCGAVSALKKATVKKMKAANAKLQSAATASSLKRKQTSSPCSWWWWGGWRRRRRGKRRPSSGLLRQPQKVKSLASFCFCGVGCCSGAVTLLWQRL